jgi:hypothetical protein
MGIAGGCKGAMGIAGGLWSVGTNVTQKTVRAYQRAAVEQRLWRRPYTVALATQNIFSAEI